MAQTLCRAPQAHQSPVVFLPPLPSRRLYSPPPALLTPCNPTKPRSCMTWQQLQTSSEWRMALDLLAAASDEPSLPCSVSLHPFQPLFSSEKRRALVLHHLMTFLLSTSRLGFRLTTAQRVPCSRFLFCGLSTSVCCSLSPTLCHGCISAPFPLTHLIPHSLRSLCSTSCLCCWSCISHPNARALSLINQRPFSFCDFSHPDPCMHCSHACCGL